MWLFENKPTVLIVSPLSGYLSTNPPFLLCLTAIRLFEYKPTVLIVSHHYLVRNFMNGLGQEGCPELWTFSNFSITAPTLTRFTYDGLP